MGNFQLIRFNRQMSRHVFLSIIKCILLLSKVQAKAVESSKHVSYADPSQADFQTFPVHEERNLKDMRDMTLQIGKPLYFGHDSFKTPLKGENYELPLPDRYELSNYENLEGMFDTKLEFPEKLKPQSRTEFPEDQVFLQSTQIKSNPYLRETTKTSKFQKKNLKSSDAGPPCESADVHDYKNKSSDELASSINVHNIVYGSKYEPKSRKNVHEEISENFHQYETEIIHKDVEDKEALEQYSGHFNRKRDSTQKKSVNLGPIDNGLKKAEEILEETHTISSQIEDKNGDKFHLEHVGTEVSTQEGKNVFNKEIMSDSKFRSFVFNPKAQPQEVFQECQTPKNESGHCRYIQHCMLPSILSSIRHFMENVCIIQDQFIGVCCPQFPVSVVLVSWPDKQENFADDSVQVPEDCGVGTNRRIVGGLAADRKAWPWMVALLNNKLKFFCGGSLINNRYVLTAAHCTFGLSSSNQIVARLGEYDFNDPREPHDDYSVIEIKRHGQYTRFTLRNDVAVLKLERPVVFNEFVKTICLPDPDKDYLGKQTTLAGWGHLNGDINSRRSNVLQEASLTVIGNEECGVTHGIAVANSVLCASAPTKDRGACNGDSGGPLMLLDSDERWKVVGIVSWGRRGCDPTFPTAYSRVNHYLDWIKEHAV